MNIIPAAMKVILITGSTDGIGLEAAKQLIAKGHQVLLHGRNPTKLEKVAAELGIDNGDSKYIADLSDLKQVYEMSQKLKKDHTKIDVLLNNAGIFVTPNPKSIDGIDIRFAVNTVAPYILTKELLETIPKKTGRVVNLSSAAQSPVNIQDAFTPGSGRFNSNQAYAQSKLALTMWTNAMAADHPDHNIFSINPASFIGTKMVKEAYGAEGKSLSIGADILSEAATGKKFERASGKYFDNDRGTFGHPHPDAMKLSKNREVVEAIDTLIRQLDIGVGEENVCRDD